MIGLCSKTYIVQKTRIVHTSSTRMTAFKLLRRAKKLPVKRLRNRPRLVREIKFSYKGIIKRRVKAPMSTFRHVVKTKRVGQGTLKGLRLATTASRPANKLEMGSLIFTTRGECSTMESASFPLFWSCV